MGAGASVDSLKDVLSLEDVKELAGTNFDAGNFDAVAEDGNITKAKLMDMIAKRTDIFLTHDWGIVDGVDNHARVSKLNKALQDRGNHSFTSLCIV